jgi:hypothetical protein
MREGNDDVRRRYTWHLNNSDLFDFCPLVALTRALLEHFVNKANLDEPEGVDGALQKAVIIAEKLATIMERIADSERRVGPVRRAEVERFLEAVSIVLATHLEPAQLPAAQRQFEELLSRDDKHPMGRIHEFERPLATPPGTDGANGTGDTGAPE